MKIVIVGGVAGGASAATRARRLDEHAEILLLQSGPDVSFASCGMPYFIGGEISDRANMSVQTPDSLYEKFHINVKVNVRVTLIHPNNQTVVTKNELTSEVMVTDYDELVLAVGAEPLLPPIPGIGRPGLFAMRNLQDMDRIDHFLSGKQSCSAAEHLHCVVAGAGFVGLEMVEQLKIRGFDVTLVELMPQILGPLDVEMAAILEQELKSRGINVITGDGIKAFMPAPDDSEDTVVLLQSGKKLPAAQFVLLGLGVRPDTAVVRDAGIDCTGRGHIIVDGYLHTNTPHVWAVGDAIEVLNPILGNDNKWGVALAGPANRQGRMVADNIFGKNRSFKGTWGASVVRIFDQVAASVGLNEKQLRSYKMPFECVHIHPGSHAGYYPGAKSINLKLLFDPQTGSIFGAQAVGQDGVDKRIDVISTAMQGGLTVEDLAELELCYAPPVGSAKDPVNMAGMAAQNIMDGLVQQIQWHEVKDLGDEAVVLDVRNPDEIAGNGHLVEGAVEIPLSKLRERLSDVPRDRMVVVSCASGQRAYYACRILQQNSFERVRNLSGAFKTFSGAPVSAKV